MNEARAYSAAAHHKDLGFLITGGKNATAEYISSTEITKGEQIIVFGGQ